MTQRLTFLDPVRSITDMKGKMTEHFRFFIRTVFQLLRYTDDDALTLADDEEISLINATTGYGFCSIGESLSRSAERSSILPTTKDGKNSLLRSMGRDG